MNHRLLKRILYDRHEVIRRAEILPRNYVFEEKANYILTGLRRAGKTTMLYQLARNLVVQGVEWNQIIFVNFEDDRLADFQIGDFDDIVLVQGEMSEKKGYYFFDEIQIVDGWEKFARRLADSGERVYISGSNARMLSREMEERLGGRFVTKHITPYSFEEYLTARGIGHKEEDLYGTKSGGRIRNAYDDYLHYGGFPETIGYSDKRSYLENIFQKIQLGDIAARNRIRNVNAMRVLIKKIAETVRSEVSYTRLQNALGAVGFRISKEVIINYISYMEEAYLIFRVGNYVSGFAERESIPKYYFSDNGILDLFLMDRDTALLENQIAIALRHNYARALFYLKSSRTGIDVDFYIPEEHLAVQVAWSLSESSAGREITSLVRLAAHEKQDLRLVIVTYEEEKTIYESGFEIQVLPASRFLLEEKWIM